MKSEPHKVTATPWWHEIWWMIRGVRINDWRHICDRCGCTGQAHFGWIGCWRFKAKMETVLLRKVTF